MERDTIMNKENIVLIGMPGVGKSTIGVVLAKVLGYKFMDSDLVIQEQTDRLLKDIIAEEGIDEFINIENKVNASINTEKSIIATGGMYCEKKYGAFVRNRNSYYLNLILIHFQKTRKLGKRGVVLKDGQTLEDLFNEKTTSAKIKCGI